jgi:hypothetical protein
LAEIEMKKQEKGETVIPQISRRLPARGVENVGNVDGEIFAESKEKESLKRLKERGKWRRDFSRVQE